MKRASLAALAGAIYFLSFAGFDLWPMCFFALTPLLWVLEDLVPASTERPLRRAFWLGALCGLVLEVGGYYWLVEMLENFSGFPLPLCIFFALVVCGWQGLLYALFACLYVVLRRRGYAVVPVAAISLVLAEWVFPMLFEAYYANMLHEFPVPIQIVDLGGPLLLSALLVATSAAVMVLLRGYLSKVQVDRRAVLAVAAFWLFDLGYGYYRVAEVDARAAQAPKLEVGLVQTNMGIFAKREDPIEGLRRHIEQSLELEKKHPDLGLLVWPESAYGRFIPEVVRNVRSRVMGQVSTPTLFGGLASRIEDGEWARYNTAFLADETGEVLGTYDKTYLLAFGEYLPFSDTFPILREWSPQSSNFRAGDSLNALELGDFRLGVLICYEDILPRFVRNFVAESQPDLLINLTNDAWFGDTHEPWQHLALARFRAVEHHRALVRSTNSGVSAVIDPVGRMVTRSGTFERASLHAEVPMLRDPTPFETLGPWPAWLSLLLALYMLARRRTGEGTGGDTGARSG